MIIHKLKINLEDNRALTAIFCIIKGKLKCQNKGNNTEIYQYNTKKNNLVFMLRCLFLFLEYF